MNPSELTPGRIVRAFNPADIGTFNRGSSPRLFKILTNNGIQGQMVELGHTPRNREDFWYWGISMFENGLMDVII